MHHNLPVSSDRLWDDLMQMAKIGATAGGGCNRLTLTTLDGEARHLLARWAERLGLILTVDGVGNMIFSRPGRDPTRPAVAIGSHLDTQPTGGKFDGPLGVLAGLEIMRALHEAHAETEAPLILINWTNEEGARFSPPMVGSGTAMGMVDEEAALAATDAGGAQLGAELQRIGWRGETAPQELRQLGAYFELHIEQGTILEEEGAQVGVVTHAAPQAWFEVTITGAEAHGGSRMAERRDALAAAAELIGGVERIALQTGQRGLVGRIKAGPDSSNVVPATVWMTVEFRADQDEILGEMTSIFHQLTRQIAGTRTVGMVVAPSYTAPVVPFDPVLVGRLRNAARSRRLRFRDLSTVIGHDAVNVARHLPAALLFIPCVGGLSHNEAEEITREWAVAGLTVLCDAVLETAGLVL